MAVEDIMGVKGLKCFSKDSNSLALKWRKRHLSRACGQSYRRHTEKCVVPGDPVDDPNSAEGDGKGFAPAGSETISYGVGLFVGLMVHGHRICALVETSC